MLEISQVSREGATSGAAMGGGDSIIMRETYPWARADGDDRRQLSKAASIRTCASKRVEPVGLLSAHLRRLSAPEFGSEYAWPSGRKGFVSRVNDKGGG